jgi:hypothetical protein
MSKILTFSMTGVLGPAGGTTPSPFAGVRICPWSDVMSHLNGYTALKVTATARVSGIGAVLLRFFEINLGTGVPLNPSVLRDTDRANPNDTLTVLDPTSPISLGQGVVLFEQAGAIVPVTSPKFRLPQDVQNTREWYVQAENVELALVRYSIDLVIEPCCSRD